jgi:hypothetical protein
MRTSTGVEKPAFKARRSTWLRVVFFPRRITIQGEEFAAGQAQGDFRRRAGAGCREAFAVRVHFLGGLILSKLTNPVRSDKEVQGLKMPFMICE